MVQRIVVIGGGGGASTLLRLLKTYENLHLTGLPVMFDSGGSTGKVSQEHGLRPVSDVLNQILALVPDGYSELQRAARALLGYRFDEGIVRGRRVDNYMVVALTRAFGSEELAIKALCNLFQIVGEVHPVSFSPSNLVARYAVPNHQAEDYEVIGESDIDSAKKKFQLRYPISYLGLDSEPLANLSAVDAILNADKVILGPGSLYTSLLPNLLIGQIRDALVKTKAKLLVPINLMTQAGQTSHQGKDGDWKYWYVHQHVYEILKYLNGGRKIDGIFVHDHEEFPFSPDVLMRYRASGSGPVFLDSAFDMGIPLSRGNYADPSEQLSGKSDRTQRSFVRNSRALTDALLSV